MVLLQQLGLTFSSILSIAGKNQTEKPFIVAVCKSEPAQCAL